MYRPVRPLLLTLLGFVVGCGEDDAASSYMPTGSRLQSISWTFAPNGSSSTPENRQWSIHYVGNRYDRIDVLEDGVLTRTHHVVYEGDNVVAIETAADGESQRRVDLQWEDGRLMTTTYRDDSGEHVASYQYDGGRIASTIYEDGRLDRTYAEDRLSSKAYDNGYRFDFYYQGDNLFTVDEVEVSMNGNESVISTRYDHESDRVVQMTRTKSGWDDEVVEVQYAGGFIESLVQGDGASTRFVFEEGDALGLPFAPTCRHGQSLSFTGGSVLQPSAETLDKLIE